MSLKLVLLHSLSGHKTIWDSCFKWVKGNGEYYYFVDLDVGKFGEKHKVWGVEAKDSNIIPEKPTGKERSSILKPRENMKQRLSQLE